MKALRIPTLPLFKKQSVDLILTLPLGHERYAVLNDIINKKSMSRIRIIVQNHSVVRYSVLMSSHLILSYLILSHRIVSYLI